MALTVLRNSIFALPRMKVLLLLAATLMLFPQQGFAWTPEIKAAAEAVANGTATPQQKALAFRSNFELNMMAEQGEIPLEQYQKVQNVFSEQAQEIMKVAAQDAGLGFEPQAVDPNKPATPKPGTDVDGHLIRRPGAPDQQITAKDVANARQSFNDRVNAYLKDNGLEPLENPSRQLKADNMPAEGITPQEASASANYLNKDGGTAYSDPVAADVEAYLRGAGPKPSSLVDWGRYVSEQQRQIMNHDHTDHLTDEITKGANAEKGSQEYIDAQTKKGEVQLEAEQTGKYQERINRTATAVGKEFGTPADLPGTIGRAASELVTANRGPSMSPIAAIVDSLRENTTLRNTESFVDTVARIAQQNPELRAEANQAIAEATRNLSPSQRGAIVERIGSDAALGGENAASQLAEAMRNNPVPDTGQQLNSKLTQPAAAKPDEPQLGASPEGKPGNIVSTIDEAAGNAIGVGELGAEAGIARQGLNTLGGGAATVLGTALTAKQLGQNIGEYAEGISRGMDSNTTDKEASQGFQQAQNAANNTAILGTVGAAAAASPVIVGGTLTGIGAYQGTRHVLENTETGKKVDAAVLNAMDGAMQKGEAASEGIKSALGVETQQQRDQNQLDALRAAFERALERGDISIKDGHTKEELMELLSHTDASNFQASLGAVVERRPAKSGTTEKPADKDNSDASKTQNAKAPADSDDSAASDDDATDDNSGGTEQETTKEPAGEDSGSGAALDDPTEDNIGATEPDTTEDNSAAIEPGNVQEPADAVSSATEEDNNAASEPDTTGEPADEDNNAAAKPDTTDDNSGATETDTSDQTTDNSGADSGGSDDSDCGCGDTDNSGATEPDTTEDPAIEDDNAAAESEATQEPTDVDNGATDEDNSAAAEPDTTEDDSGATQPDDAQESADDDNSAATATTDEDGAADETDPDDEIRATCAANPNCQLE
jgi:hypothetical protein